MARAVGITTADIPAEERIYLAGFEPNVTAGGERWIRLASLEPERIDKVSFFRNDRWFETAYDEPFAVGSESNWRWRRVRGVEEDQSWRAEVVWADGSVSERVWRSSG